MELGNIFRKKYRDIVAMSVYDNRAYMAGLRQNRAGEISLLWIESAAGEEGELQDKILGRLLQHNAGGVPVVLCIHSEELLTGTRELPGLSEKEVKQAIRLEMDYSGNSGLWTYQYTDGTATLKQLPMEAFNRLVGAYQGELFILGIMGMETGAGQDYPDWSDMGWKGSPPEAGYQELQQLIGTATDYLRGSGYVFAAAPPQLLAWDWLKICGAFLLLNIFAAAVIGLGGLWQCRELAGELHGCQQQAALLSDVSQKKQEAEEMKGQIRERSGILASLHNKGLGWSAYGLMVKFSGVPQGGVTFSELTVNDHKQLVIKGGAESLGALVKYNSTAGLDMAIEQSEEKEQGNVEFTCKGQL